MSTWERATFDRLCPMCNRVVKVGEPILVYRFTPAPPRKTPIEKIRCASCDGPAPPDLPAHIEEAPRPPLAMHRLGLLPLEFGRTATREPGEED
jgi:hypothetical protein